MPRPNRTAPAIPQPGVTLQREAPAPPLVLLVASFGAFLAFLDSTVVNVAFPDLSADFPGTTVGHLSWVLNAYNVVLAAFLVAAGRVADLLGRRRAFMAGVALFTVASVLCAVAPSVDLLIAARVLQGAGAALLIPASLALVVEGFDASRRAHGVGLWGASAAIAAGLGPPIGGALVAVSGWRLAFLINIPLGLAAYALAKRHLVESRAPGVRRMPDLRGASLLAASLGLLTLGVIQGPEQGWGEPLVVASLVLAVATLVGFVLSSRVAAVPLLDPRMLRTRTFAVAGVATVVAGAGFYAYLLTHVLWLSYVWDYSLLRAGLAVAPGALVAAVVAAVLGKVADARGHRVIALPGALVWAASFLWYLEQVGTTPDFVGTWLPGQVLSGIGVGMTLPILGSAAVVTVPGGTYAVASAVMTSARQLGAVGGIAVLVLLIGTPSPATIVDGLRSGWTFSAGCFVVVALVTAALGNTREAAQQAAQLEAAGATDPAAGDAAGPVAPAAAPPPTPAPVAAAPDGPRDELSDVALFAGLPPRTRARIRGACDVVVLRSSQVLFQQGEESDALYVVQAGSLDVAIDGTVVARLERDAVVGELGLLTGEPRSATVTARRETTLLRLSAEAFASVADAALLRALSTGLARRLQAARQDAVAPRRAVVVAVVGADRGAPVAEVTAGLADLLGRHLDVGRPGQVEADGLTRAERDHDLVLLDARAGTDKAWRERCLRTADRVVLVASQAQPPRKALAPGADLVVSGDAARPGARGAWARSVAARSTTTADRLGPLSDRLAGRSVGLVLGGGGARAFAHLGVLEVLEGAGITVDRVAGSSVGAAIAAAWALGHDAASVDALIYGGFVRSNPIADYTLPRHGIVKGRATVDLLERAIGDSLIEELPREFRCVSVDLLARQRVVHDSGRLVDAVASSLRLPGLYPPYVNAGRLHVDGGVLDNLPVATLDPREGPRVAVSISFGGGAGSRGPVDPGRRLRVPPLGDTLMRTLMMASGQAAAESIRQAEVVIEPAAAGVGLLEFHQIDRMKEQGRVAAEQALPQLDALLAAGVSPRRG